MQTIQDALVVDQTGQHFFQAGVTGASQQFIWLTTLGAFVRALSVLPTRERRESALEAACRTDQEIVAKHPGLTRYVRPRLAGEFEPSEADAKCTNAVLVTVIAPGVRSRQPVKVDVYQRARG